MIFRNFLESIGNTPLIKLRKASELTGCNILGKAEFLNPGGSVKDRAAKAIILDAAGWCIRLFLSKTGFENFLPSGNSFRLIKN